MMYHLDGRWRRQSLVYFGEPARLIRDVARSREARYVPGPYCKYLVAAND